MRLGDINKVLRERYGDLRLVHGDGYWYFTGKVSGKMTSTSIYQYTLPTLETVLMEVESRLVR